MILCPRVAPRFAVPSVPVDGRHDKIYGTLETNMNDSEHRPLLYDYFKRLADSLWAQYQKSKSQHSSANISHNREDILGKEFLGKVLPPLLVVRKDEVWNAYRNQTGLSLEEVDERVRIE